MLSYLRKVVRSWQERLEAKLEQHRAYRELASLDDRSLADIGITRAAIPYVVFRRRDTECGRGIRKDKKLPVANGGCNPVAFGEGHGK